MSPSPNRYHQDILFNIAYLLRQYLERNSIGKVYVAPFDVCLTDLNVYQPDIVFVSQRKFSILTDQGAEGAPDLVVEILSPRTAEMDKGIKREIYFRTGVKELWIVDPDSKGIAVYRLRENAETPAATYGENETFESELLPGLKIETSRIFF